MIALLIALLVADENGLSVPWWVYVPVGILAGGRIFKAVYQVVN